MHIRITNQICLSRFSLLGQSMCKWPTPPFVITVSPSVTSCSSMEIERRWLCCILRTLHPRPESHGLYRRGRCHVLPNSSNGPINSVTLTSGDTSRSVPSWFKDCKHAIADRRKDLYRRYRTELCRAFLDRRESRREGHPERRIPKVLSSHVSIINEERALGVKCEVI